MGSRRFGPAWRILLGLFVRLSVVLLCACTSKPQVSPSTVSSDANGFVPPPDSKVSPATTILPAATPVHLFDRLSTRVHKPSEILRTLQFPSWWPMAEDELTTFTYAEWNYVRRNEGPTVSYQTHWTVAMDLPDAEKKWAEPLQGKAGTLVRSTEGKSVAWKEKDPAKDFAISFFPKPDENNRPSTEIIVGDFETTNFAKVDESLWSWQTQLPKLPPTELLVRTVQLYGFDGTYMQSSELLADLSAVKETKKTIMDPTKWTGTAKFVKPEGDISNDAVSFTLGEAEGIARITVIRGEAIDVEIKFS